ncbi:hypothetical protein ACFVYE_24730 [Streptomyces sp. NPDC058239]
MKTLVRNGGEGRNMRSSADFVCVFCEEALPLEWNVDGAGAE